VQRFINCIAHNSSEGNLLLGDTHTALFDCGMAFCAKETIENVKRNLAGRPLDYIIITHTHYDHIGAMPFFRKEWQNLRVVATQSGAEVMLKSTPRKVYRELSMAASELYGTEYDSDYSDDAFHADIIIKDKDIISLGGISVEALETPGHTRDSVCYFIKELELLLLNETPGVLLPDGSLYPCYLTSCNDAINSIKKCSEVQYKKLSMPHRGVICDADAVGYFDKAMSVNITCRDFILEMNAKGMSGEEMAESFFKKYGSEILLSFQPKEAFMANAKATIACTVRR